MRNKKALALATGVGTVLIPLGFMKVFRPSFFEINPLILVPLLIGVAVVASRLCYKKLQQEVPN